MDSANVQTDTPPIKQERLKAICRQRRIIFNDDMYELDREWANTTEGFLRGRIAPLVGTQVDTISFSVIEADAPVYDSKVQPIYGQDAHGANPPYWPNIGPNIKALAKGGYCPVQIITDFAHEHAMESWAHVRMNDVHDQFIDGWLSLWKKQHPELLVDTKGMLPGKKLYVTAKDFRHEACRARKLEIIEELAQRYDIDGYELDYIRHPVLFSRTMRGEPTTEQEVRIITDLMWQIRQLLNQAASRRGRPFVIAVRVPDTIEQSMHIGLDVKAWLDQDLVDILIIGGGYTPFTLDISDYVELAGPYGVPIYPCINMGTVLNDTLAVSRALASRWYHADADGIYTFNFGTPFEYKTGDDLIENRSRLYASFYDMGDRTTLVGTNKLYRTDGPVYEHYPFISADPPLPAPLRRGASRKILLSIGDDVETAAQAGDIADLLLDLHLTGPLNGNPLSTSLNGQNLDSGELVDGNADGSGFIMRYKLNAPPLTIGQNTIEVAIADGERNDDEPIMLNEMRLRINYK